MSKRIKKPRILYLARTAPTQISGATLAMRRHFIEHDDIELFVVTSEAFADPRIPSLCLKTPSLWRRIKQTRLFQTVHNIEMLAHAHWLPHTLIYTARLFEPDAVFTVADLTLSETARLLARHLGIPLIVNFQDWWPRGQFYYAQEAPLPQLVPLFEGRFRRLYQQSSLAFCTSEGMREFLGDHPNSHVLYPVGAGKSSVVNVELASRQPTGKRQLVYTGTAFGSYGQMLLKLADALKNHPSWELVIYGKRPNWPEERIATAEVSGLYRGFLPFEQLCSVLASADACLSVMSFDPELEVMMRTSFTTKVLDYCNAGRPILMWGPSFCSPIRLIDQYQAGLTITSAHPAAVLASLNRLDQEPGLAAALAHSAQSLARDYLSHNSIHGVFVREINRLIES
jgi:hypothetical protein